MEKRRVTITVGGQPYSFVSDDSDEYIRTLEQRTNAALKQTAGFAPSVYAGAILSVISQTDRLLREEKSAQTRKTEEPEKPQKGTGQKESLHAGKRPGFRLGPAGRSRAGAGEGGGSDGARQASGTDAENSCGSDGAH